MDLPTRWTSLIFHEMIKLEDYGWNIFHQQNYSSPKTRNNVMEESSPLKDSNIGLSLKMASSKQNSPANYYLDRNQKTFPKLAIGSVTWTMGKLDTF